MNDKQENDQKTKKTGWLGRLRNGLGRTSTKIEDGIGAIFTKRKLDDEALEELEEFLISADLGVATAAKLVQALGKKRFGTEVPLKEAQADIAEAVAEILAPIARPLVVDKSQNPHVILLCGVNGGGKTTTIGKLARQFVDDGLSVTLVAADTFRAAAVEQLHKWGERAGCRVISGTHEADAAGLVYEALQKTREDNTDVLLIDTAGRLQNKNNLMAELQKIVRVIKKLDASAPHDCVLVLDAGVGQNAHSQVEVFKKTVDVSGLIMTKLDGTAKGGVVVALADKFALPIHAVGVGESMDDLRSFEPLGFARSLIGLNN